MDSKESNKKENRNDKDKNKKIILIALIVILSTAIVFTITFGIIKNNNKEDTIKEDEISYTELIKQIDDGNVEKIKMTVGSTSVKVTLKGEEEPKKGIVPSTQAFVELVQEKVQDGNNIELVQVKPSVFVTIGDKAFTLLPTALMIVLFVLLIQMQGLGGKGKVAIVIGMPKAFAARQRTEGFEKWMKNNYPDIQIIAKQNADWDRNKARELAGTWIKNNPDLSAIFCNNDGMALGVVEAVKSSGKDILIVGVDGIGEAYDSIRNGGLSATIDSFPRFKSQIALECLIRIIGGQDIPRVIWTPQALIDISNVNETPESIINWKDPEFEN